MLRTFLRPGYEQFYTQSFDLAVAHLRLPRAPQPLEDVDTPLPLTTLRQALIMVFKEAFPLARNLYPSGHQPLVARGIRLDSAYLEEADLKQAWIPQASMREADLRRADLHKANLHKADLRKANLHKANLSYADLRQTKLTWASLGRANLHEADLSYADLHETYLRNADLRAAKLRNADLRVGILRQADLRQADLRQADLRGANLEDALSLEDTDLRGVIGLTIEQLEACKAKGAIIDDSTTISSQSTVSTSSSSQSNDAQAPSATSAQGSIPTLDPGGSSTALSQQDQES